MAISDVILTADTTAYQLNMEMAATTAERTFWRMGIASTRAAQAIIRNWALVQASMKTFTNLAIAGAVALGGMAVAVGMAGAAVSSFDDNLRRIAAVGGKEFQDNIESVRGRIFDLATTYGVAVDDIAAGMIELVKSGFEYAQVMEMADAITQAARANQISFAETATLTVAAVNLFKDSGYSAAQMLEIMHTAANEAVLDLEQFNDILGFVGSTAYIFNLSLEEVSAMMGALSQAAFHSQQSVRTLMLKLAAESEDIEAILASAGIQIDIITDDMQLNLTEIIRAMEGATLSTDQWIAIMESLNIRSGAAFTTIVALSGEYERILGELGPDTENLGEAAEYMATSIQALWAQITATLQEAIFTPEFVEELSDVLETLKGTFEDISPLLQEVILQLVSGLKDNLPAIVDLLSSLMRTTVALMPVIKVFATVGGVLATVIAAIHPDVLAFAISMIILSKILGPVTTALNAMNLSMGTTVALQASLFAGLGGLLLLMSDAEPTIRFFGAALMVAAGAMTALAIARAAFAPEISPLQLAGAAAVGGGIAAAIAGVVATYKSYQHGTEFVPESGPYMLHKGEAVIPAEQNTFGPWQGGTQVVNVYDASMKDIDEVLAGYRA